MANTFKVITRDVAPASSGTPETLYTVQSGSTVIVLGLTLANVHTAQVTGTVQLNVGDIIKIDCSVADKLSVTMSYMEIT